jgi:hypothetical protein
MSPGAGAELKHLLNGVKSKTTKPEGLDLKVKGQQDESLNLKGKGININAESLNQNVETLNLKALGEAVKGANSNRQTIAVWSPVISAVMWYLKKTTPEFSISDEARTILEEGLKKKYPGIYQRMKEEMSQY